MAKVLNAAGRTLITAGVLILLFVAYQLWGTGIREAQAQDRLQHQFEQKVADADKGDSAVVGSSTSAASSASSGGSSTSSTPPDSVSTSTSPATTTSIAPPAEAPAEGEVVGKIEMPTIGLSAYVVEGVGVDDLKTGPGHYPGTPLPGQQGNASIAGHRTTYGAPFGDIDNLNVTDPIIVTTLQGQKLTYKVRQALPADPGSSPDRPYQVVSPSQVDVLDDKGDNRLTLTACHPKYSASERIVVTAVLQGTALPAPPPTTTPAGTPPAPKPDLSVSGESAPKLPAILLGLLCAAIWVAAWFIGKRWRKWPSYAIGLPFFLVALFYFFENFSRLLPPNY